MAAEAGIDVRATGHRATALVLLFLGALVALFWTAARTPEVGLVVLPLIPIAVRMAMLRVTANSDVLHIREFWHSYDLSRSEIVRFDVEDRGGTPMVRERVVYAHTSDAGRLRLAATRRPYFKVPPRRPRPGFRNEADDIGEELNAWLEPGA